MPEDILQTIRSRGYWRINFRPVTFSERFASVAECREAVYKAVVELRGWEYPAVLQGAPNVSRITTDKYFQLENDWEKYIELWRMYKSGQFIHYLALREDWMERDSRFSSTFAPQTRLALISSVYQATEIFTFLSRLAQTGIYDDGVEVAISLEGLKDRELWIEDSSRVDFSYPRKTGATRLELKKTYSKEDVVERSTELARDMLLKWYDAFDWHPSVEQVTSDQEKLLTRRI